MRKYRLTKTDGHSFVVQADKCYIEEDWIVFYIWPPQGGNEREIHRFRSDMIFSIERL